MNMANGSVLVMSDVSNGTAAAMAARPLPSLFAPSQREQGHGDVRILGELSAARRTGAGGGGAGKALALVALLVVVGVLVVVMWVPGREPAGVGAGGREPVDVVAMSAPVTTGAGRERLPDAQRLEMPPVQESLAPAATIVEMAAQRVEQPKMVGGPAGGARARMVDGGRSSDVAGRGTARAAQREVARGSVAGAKSKVAGERMADAGRSAPLARTRSAAPRLLEDQVDADVQVIEAIVTRAH